MLDGKVVELHGKDLEFVAPEVRCAAACWQLAFFGTCRMCYSLTSCAVVKS